MAKTAEEVRQWLNYITKGELAYLKGLAKASRPGAKFINIGAGGGTSGTAFMESNPNIKVWTIDPQKESSPFGCLEGERAVLEAAGLWPSDRYTAIHARSQDFAKEWDGGKVDVVFVDGDHTYEGLKGDIEGWMPHLKRGGLFLVHDYKKVDSYKKNNPNEEITPELIKKIKPLKYVDEGVDELLLGKYVMVDIIDTTIIFKNEKIPTKKVANVRKTSKKTKTQNKTDNKKD